MKPAYRNKSRAIQSLAITAAFIASYGMSEAKGRSADLDGDGIVNRVDSDVDGDGIPNGEDPNVDGGVCRRGPFKGDYVGDRLRNGAPAELDIDADGSKDDSDSELQTRATIVLAVK